MKLNPPLVVEVTRGPMIESLHLVDAVVVDADGSIVETHGSPERPVFPRSAVKALQALALVESGAVDRYGLEPRHVALACSSHGGEEMHVAGAGEMLAAAGLAPSCLECGAHWPALKADQDRLTLAGLQPGPIHNNCSGKHSGFLCVAAHEGFDPAGYVGINHPVQRAIASILTDVTGTPHVHANHGIDGCSIPTYAVPLESLARAFARFGAGEGGGPLRSRAMLRIRDACLSHPAMVGGTGKFDTIIMAELAGRLFTKTGAEGVFIAALPEKGIGIALKARDGASRAAEVAVARLIESLLELDETAAMALNRLANPAILNWNGIRIGEVR